MNVYSVRGDKMKSTMKNIDMICTFDVKGDIRPVRFRIIENDNNEVIKINRIVSKEKQKFTGKLIWVYDCQSIINGIDRRYQIIYYIDNCQWILSKI